VDPPQDTSLLTAGYLRGPLLSLQVLHPLMCFSIGTTGKMKRDGSSTHPLSPVPLSCRVKPGPRSVQTPARPDTPLEPTAETPAGCCPGARHNPFPCAPGRDRLFM
jgi:hypothetical protein